MLKDNSLQNDLPKAIGTLSVVRAGKVEPFVRGVSAINKIPIAESMAVNLLGLADDEQAEHKFHGGHLKALHQMPITTYHAINEQFGLNAQIGSLGENLTVITDGEPMCERNVCIGDVYQFGDGDDSVQVRVVQPRRPCYKINDRLGNANVSYFVAREGIAGWYYQVVRTGRLRANLPVYLLARPYSFAKLSDLWALINQKSPIDTAVAERWLAIDCLETSWKQKIANKRRN
ncbi:MOSC domain-containing protein [Moraxella caviae]|uniref:MOSC domain-containing protein n=1 Tax=Moraxella caviae TaxID=34060 RepID=A0A1T0A5V5_9GAMM|nr:MOSC domain-containing protein [Moraxella caviae]